MVSGCNIRTINLIAGVFVAIVFAVSRPIPISAQTSPQLEVDAVSARTNNGSKKTRLDVYTRVPYSSLRFTTSSSGFDARYGVTIEVHELEGKSGAGNLIDTRIWEQKVSVREFAQTQTDQLYDRAIQSLELAPGNYLLEFQVEDQASREMFVRELPVRVRDLSKSIAISDLILIDAFDQSANSITPTVSNRIGSEQTSFQLFYEIYSSKPQSVRVAREVVRVRKSSGPPSVKSLLGIGRDEEVANAEVSYQETSPKQLRTGRNQYVVEIPLEDFKVGEYIARVSLLDEQGRVIDRSEKPLTLQWTGLDEHVRDLQDAIAQLSYIAKKGDIDNIKQGKTEQERLVRFLDFWKRRDPTPGTDRNERMEEYYYRITFANRQYGNFGDGWKTDRGQIMVLFGEPDHVERHPYNFDVKPYEVWYYYRIGRRFIFIDESGVGDYELLVPYWDERTRIH